MTAHTLAPSRSRAARPAPFGASRRGAASACAAAFACAAASAQPDQPAASSAYALRLDSVLQAPEAPAAAPVPDDQQLHVNLATYLWLTSLSGDLGVAGLEFDVALDFSTVVEEADSVFGLSGAIDFEYKRWVFQVNGIWTSVDASGERTAFQNVNITGDLTMDMSWFETFGGYRFIQASLGKKEEDSKAMLAVDGFVGGRITTLDVEADLRAEAMITLPGGIELEAGTSRSLDHTESWFEPFVGARAIIRFDEHLSIAVRGDVGGFGVDGSDFSWQAIGLVGYDWRLDGWDFGLFGGYRALGQDYTDGDFKWDIITHGPIVGLQATFSF